nr:MAG TPA: hypothetical protein [Bacteriophage sp.]
MGVILTDECGERDPEIYPLCSSNCNEPDVSCTDLSVFISTDHSISPPLSERAFRTSNSDILIPP